MNNLATNTFDPRVIRAIARAPREYQPLMREFLEALNRGELSLATIEGFTGDPKLIGPSRFNTRLKSARRLVRDLADLLPLTAAQRWELAKILSEKKLVRPAPLAGDRAGDLQVTTRLYDRIVGEFNGHSLLFEHDGEGYSPIATTQRIKMLSMQILGKPYTAHSLRHACGQRWRNLYGLEAASEKLRHQSLQTTRDFYVSVTLTPEQLEQAVELKEHE